MQNCDRSVKSKGAIIFANNTRDFDYIKIAEANARLIERYLRLPTTILNSDSQGNRRLDATTGQFVEWKNLGRSRAYELSPYDETLLLDADYLMLDDTLLKMFDTGHPYLLVDKNTYVTDPNLQERMGQYSLPFVWATAVMFRKDPRTEMLFDLIKLIEANYGYYRALYNIDAANYRNDYAFAIAHYILSGYQISQEQMFPVPITTVPGQLDRLELRKHQIVARTPDRAYVLPRSNIHILSKHYLQTRDFQDFVEAALA
jgi:hypothetical protein